MKTNKFDLSFLSFVLSISVCFGWLVVLSVCLSYSELGWAFKELTNHKMLRIISLGEVNVIHRTTRDEKKIPKLFYCNYPRRDHEGLKNIIKYGDKINNTLFLIISNKNVLTE